MSENPDHLQELQKLNVSSLPTTVIDDQVVLGFDQQQLATLLGL